MLSSCAPEPLRLPQPVRVSKQVRSGSWDVCHCSTASASCYRRKLTTASSIYLVRPQTDTANTCVSLALPPSGCHMGCP